MAKATILLKNPFLFRGFSLKDSCQDISFFIHYVHGRTNFFGKKDRTLNLLVEERL
jgi:hypothetical protein